MNGEDDGLPEYLGTEEAEHERGLRVYFQKELDKLPLEVTGLVLTGVFVDVDDSPPTLVLRLEAMGCQDSEPFLDLEDRFQSEIRNYPLAFPVDDTLTFTRMSGDHGTN